MKILLCFLLCLPLLASAAIEPKKRLLINEVLELTAARATVEALRVQNVESVKASLIKEAGDAANRPYTKLALERMTAKYDDYSKLQFSWYRIEEKYLELYNRSFTEAQLKALVAFLKSDAGKVTTATAPQVMAILETQLVATAAETQAKVAELFRQAQDEVDQQMRLDATKLITASIEEIETMARGGSSGAQYLMGAYLVEGIRLDKNPAEGVKWLKLAVAQEHAGAQGRLGGCYLFGEGVEKDLPQAVELLTAAAARDDMMGSYWLGTMYRIGDGVTKDTKRAFPLLLAAANAGHGGAQYDVATLYWNGDGVERNLIEAYAWVRVSEDAVGEPATKLREFMGPRLSSEDGADGMVRSAEIRREIQARGGPKPK